MYQYVWYKTDVLAFKEGTNHKKKEGHSSFDITGVVMCKRKGYDYEQPSQLEDRNGLYCNYS